MKQVRCAIYTRKSSDEGLEQDFNSLDAQREACAAYVLSQASEGWTLAPGRYDDGGLSGGTLERPALQRLLAEVAAGQVDIIVVYKVDRLTRSLLDFAKLVETLDQANTSFVSVTQSFNTTTSMGRLTLNMLLSFAQFEREVTAERIRDKIAASKAKGMWMGGTPPLGYSPHGRSLAIVEEHAVLIRRIYARYLSLGNVRLLADELRRDGIGAPRRQRQSGTMFGERAFTRGQLYAILKNPVYIGRIVHKGCSYAGRQPAIIDQAEWDAVQQKLAAHLQGSRKGRAPNQSLLAGRIVDEAGEALIAVHATKGTTRYRYYVSRSAHHGGAGPALRIPAREIESLVGERVAGLLVDPIDLLMQTKLAIEPADLPSVLAFSRELSLTLKGSGRGLSELVKQVRVGSGKVAIEIDTGYLASVLGVTLASGAPATFTVIEPARLTRTGRVVRLIDGAGRAARAAADPSLITLLATARRWWALLQSGKVNIKTLARNEGVTQSWMTRVVRLAFLAPQVVEAALGGQLRAEAGSRMLLRSGAVGLCWDEQAQCYLAGHKK